MKRKLIDVHWDMETQDPDDAFTLCLLATHPRINLKGVTVFPGGFDQVGVVKHILEHLGRSDVPVGAVGHDDSKSRVSGFHYKWLGKIEPQKPDGTATEVILNSRSLDCTLITGAPLRNIHQALLSCEDTLFKESPSLRGAYFFRDWTCQGGFAGDNIVPEEHRLEKFKGRMTCPTFNLNGDVTASKKLLLDSTLMNFVRMVSKNICHGLIFNPERAEKMPRGAHAGLDLLLDGMQTYFEKTNPTGKALHDTIAAALTLDTSAATWVRGTPYREKGEWGFEPEGMFLDYGEGDYPRMITTSVDVEKMYEAWAV